MISILVNGKKIITHTLEKPWIYAGNGEATYDMFRGNFKIKDYLIEKVALSNFEISQKKDEIIVTFSKGKLNSLKVVFTLEGERTVVKFLENPNKLNRLWLRLVADKEEHIYGCGEQFSNFDLRGKNYPLWTSEQGIGRNKNNYTTFMADKRGNAGGDYYTTFFPQPTFVSS
ncbi:MAG: family 31 glycosyl hydrolase, alpha-glucosidase, partial [Clostridium sp.]|nr:family 31 glycosyl hydrolase, alpha-glucosidase [Clostridium sp.]